MCQQTLKIYEEYNKHLKKRVNEKFVEIFDEMAGKIKESEQKRIELEDKKYDLIILNYYFFLFVIE